MMRRILRWASVRRCNGRCGDDSAHTHHLTWIGRRRYTGGHQ